MLGSLGTEAGGWFEKPQMVPVSETNVNFVG